MEKVKAIITGATGMIGEGVHSGLLILKFEDIIELTG